MKKIQTVIAFLVLMLTSVSLLAQSGKILDRLPFEVIMDIVWQGQDIQIRKVVSCNMRKRLYPKDHPTSVDPGQNLSLQEVWDQDVNRIYHVLPSKEVLIIELPHVCSPLNKSLLSLPDGFVPIMYWVDNADSPKVAEEIVSYRYFTDNPRRRFEFRRLHVVEARQLADKIDDDQRLVGLIWSPFVKYDAFFTGLSAVALPKSIWGQYPALAAELSKYTGTGPVDRNMVRQTAPNLLGACMSSIAGIASDKECQKGFLDHRPYVIPASLENGVWRLQYDEVGVRRDFRYVDFDKMDRRGCVPGVPQCNVERGTYRFEIDGKVYERSMRSNAGIFFDVKKQMLLRLGFGLVRSTFNQEVNK